MRVAFFFGFLGSGKTTLARRLIDEWGRDRRIALIVNEFGDVGIDGDILSANNVDMIELSSGCLCCTLRGSLLGAIEELSAKNAFEYLIVEASGIAQPADLAEALGALSMKEDLEIGTVVTVVDAAKFDKFEKMLGEFYLAQIASADIVILNKIDLAAARELEEARRKVRALNCDADIFLTERCEIDLDLLLGGRRKGLSPWPRLGNSIRGHELESQGNGPGHHVHEPARVALDVASFVLNAGGNFDGAGLRSFFRSLPDTVWRVKGFTVVDGRPALIQYTAEQLDIAATQARNNNNLVFIGRNMDRVAVERAFRDLAQHRPDRAAEDPASLKRGSEKPGQRV
jgi:G3E family GTPase